MNSSVAVWLALPLFLVAVTAAKLPFANEQLLNAAPRRAPKEPGWRLLELLPMWGLLLGAGFSLEAHAGQLQPQGWAFDAVIGFLFMTLAFAGFVRCHLRRQP